MKKLIFILSFIPFFTQNILSQNIGRKDEVYEVKSGDKFRESIHLYSNGYFVYNYFFDMYQLEARGNWQQRDSFLILDSYPQKEKMIVREILDTLRMKEKLTISVMTKKYGDPITYHLTVITEKGDTVLFKDQIEKTTVPIPEKVKAFWIEDTRGFLSPIYYIQSKVNIYELLFEIDRTFENEHWLIISKDSIRPFGFDGKYQPYVLKRK